MQKMGSDGQEIESDKPQVRMGLTPGQVREDQDQLQGFSLTESVPPPAPQFQAETTLDLGVLPLGTTIVAGHRKHDPTIKRNFVKSDTKVSGTLWIEFPVAAAETFWATDDEIVLPAVITWHRDWGKTDGE